MQQNGSTKAGTRMQLAYPGNKAKNHLWVGSKGLLQVLREWGFIDISKLSHYTMYGKENPFGVIWKDMSLKFLMSNCQDFKEEESLLQSMGRSMGILVDRMPKCHCELAGEGIEYSWGCSKNSYHRTLLSQKRGKENFRAVVRKCLSCEVLTT